MKVRLLATLIVAGLATALTGCYGGHGAAPTPSQPSPTKTASPIPVVAKDPRDVAVMARRPCELLTNQQAKAFGLDLPPEQLEGLLGTLRCKWKTTTRDR